MGVLEHDMQNDGVRRVEGMLGQGWGLIKANESSYVMSQHFIRKQLHSTCIITQEPFLKPSWQCLHKDFEDWIRSMGQRQKVWSNKAPV